MRFRGSLLRSILPPSGFQALPCCCLHIYIPQSRTSACGGFIGSVLRTRVGRTLCGLCLASTCAPIIADRDPLVKGFLRSFYEAPRLVLGRSPTARLVLCHYGVPLLGYGGRPSEGLGSASPPDNVILSHYRREVNPFLRFF